MPNLGQAYARAFMMHREPLSHLLSQVPNDKADFAAWEGGMSFQKLTDHLAISSERMTAMLNGEALGKPEPAEDFAAAKARLNATTDPIRSALESLSEDQLNAVIEAFGGRQMPVYTLIDFMREHEVHHKGQLWMMARMVGLEPGLFIKLG